jgi:hypothetical protein
MTDEEMADEYATKHCECYEKGQTDYDSLKQAYLAGLKARLNIRSCQNCRHNNKSCPNDGSCNHYSKWESYKNPQLTKAKEIICEYVRLANLEKEDTVAIWQLYHKAEQFLKEVEK